MSHVAGRTDEAYMALAFDHCQLYRLLFLPSELGLCSSLQKINVDHNFLTSLPPAPPQKGPVLGRLMALHTLSARYNKLTTLPFDLWRARSLTNIYIDGNRKLEPAIVEAAEKGTEDLLDHLEWYSKYGWTTQLSSPTLEQIVKKREARANATPPGVDGTFETDFHREKAERVSMQATELQLRRAIEDLGRTPWERMRVYYNVPGVNNRPWELDESPLYTSSGAKMKAWVRSPACDTPNGGKDNWLGGSDSSEGDLEDRLDAVATSKRSPQRVRDELLQMFEGEMEDPYLDSSPESMGESYARQGLFP